MMRIVKFVLGSGFLCVSLFALSACLTGCSGESNVPVEEAKISGVSPGEYLDSHDAKPNPKGAKKARAKH